MPNNKPDNIRDIVKVQNVVLRHWDTLKAIRYVGTKEQADAIIKLIDTGDMNAYSQQSFMEDFKNFQNHELSVLGKRVYHNDILIFRENTLIDLCPSQKFYGKYQPVCNRDDSLEKKVDVLIEQLQTAHVLNSELLNNRNTGYELNSEQAEHMHRVDYYLMAARTYLCAVTGRDYF